MCDTQPNRTSLATGPVLSLLTVASVPVPLSSVNAYGGFVRGNCHRKTCEPNGNESFVFLFFYLFLLRSRILALYIYYTVRESNKRLNGFPRIADWAAHETTCVVNVKNKRKNRGRWQKKKGTTWFGLVELLLFSLLSSRRIRNYKRKKETSWAFLHRSSLSSQL